MIGIVYRSTVLGQGRKRADAPGRRMGAAPWSPGMCLPRRWNGALWGAVQVGEAPSQAASGGPG